MSARRFTAVLLAASLPAAERIRNSIGMELAPIESGSFDIGETAAPVPDELTAPLTYVTRAQLQKRYPWGDASKFKVYIDHARLGDFDERPVHRVTITRPFWMSVHEVTNAQYEQFDPSHRAMRGKNGFSKQDDEAVVFVSWHQAAAFCDWLSRKEGRRYRLPTEAEWEYACRAGTRSLYAFGEALPPAYRKNVKNSAFDEPSDIVPLTVGQTPPNGWGLFDMHGNVEEWASDWYGPYTSEAQRDPVGYSSGDFKVTRGGSHGTLLYYLRSANRAGLPPEAANWITGFRVVIGEPSGGKPLRAVGPAATAVQTRWRPADIDPSKPHFRGPRPFVRIPEDSHGPLYSHHNHDTALAECPNGDLLAIWYSCVQERGRELMVASSRLRRGAEEWEPASVFWDAPDRNDHAPALWFDGKDTLYHFNALGIAGRWAPGAILLRRSTDNGARWSKAQLLSPDFDFRSMLAESVFRAADGSIVVAADLTRHMGSDRQGSTIWVSGDEGRTWRNPSGTIPGVHAAVVQLKDGRLMALGRGGDVEGRMPMSLSSDMGKSWSTLASAFPPIAGGQRAVVLRLKEGPILFASFARDVGTLDSEGNRHLTNLFAAISEDEGRTWPVRRIVAGPGSRAALILDRGRIRQSPGSSEPLGYLSVTQDRAGGIHLLTSINHYEFNLAWLRQRQPDVAAGPETAPLPTRAKLADAPKGHKLPGAAARWANDRTADMTAVDSDKGFTVEARARVASASANPSGFDLEAFATGGSPRFASRYSIRVTPSAVLYLHNNGYREIARGLENSGAHHTYRMAVRPDTAVQIYRDRVLLATMPAELTSSLQLAARGSFVEWGNSGPGDAAVIERIGLDLAGPFAP